MDICVAEAVSVIFGVKLELLVIKVKLVLIAAVSEVGNAVVAFVMEGVGVEPVMENSMNVENIADEIPLAVEVVLVVEGVGTGVASTVKTVINRVNSELVVAEGDGNKLVLV